MTCQGPALGIVKAVGRNNGVEVWRRLFQRYEPDAGPRVQNMMTRIPQPGHFLETRAGIESALVGWEGLLGEPVKIATRCTLAILPTMKRRQPFRQKRTRRCVGGDKNFLSNWDV